MCGRGCKLFAASADGCRLLTPKNSRTQTDADNFLNVVTDWEKEGRWLFMNLRCCFCLFLFTAVGALLFSYGPYKYAPAHADVSGECKHRSEASRGLVDWQRISHSICLRTWICGQNPQTDAEAIFWDLWSHRPFITGKNSYRITQESVRSRTTFPLTE